MTVVEKNLPQFRSHAACSFVPTAAAAALNKQGKLVCLLALNFLERKNV